MQECKPTTHNAKLTFSRLSLEIYSTVSFFFNNQQCKKACVSFYLQKIVLANRHIFWVLCKINYLIDNQKVDG